MSAIDIIETVKSTVDLQAEFNDKGLSVSVWLDSDEIEHTAHYDDMAIDIVGDPEKYDDEKLKKIIEGLDYMSKYIKESMGDA